MNQKKFLVLVLFAALLALQSVSHAAEDESGFFGIKKFVKKGASANSSKKKIIDVAAGAASKTAGSQGNDSELTDEEKNMIQEMSKKAPKDKAAAV